MFETDAAKKVTLLLVGSLTIMSGAAIAPALPGLQQHFVDTENVELLVRLTLTMPALAITLTAPFAGYLIDRFGRSRLLLIAIVAYSLAGGAGLILDDLYELLGSRVLLGVGVAFIMTTATALVGDYFPDSERTRFMGVQTAFQGLAGLLFMICGGLLADISWRGPFLVYAAALLMVPFAFRNLPEPARHAREARAAGGMIASVPWAATLVLLTVGILNGIFFYIIPTQLPFLLEEIGAHGGTASGVALGVSMASAGLVSLVYGRVRERMGVAAIFMVGFAAMAIAFFMIAHSDAYFPMLVSMLVSGVGMGLNMPNLVVAILAVAPEEIRGRMSGGLIMSVFVGQFLSPVVSQPLVNAFGLGPAFAISAGALALLALAAGAIAIAYPRFRSRSAVRR